MAAPTARRPQPMNWSAALKSSWPGEMRRAPLGPPSNEQLYAYQHISDGQVSWSCITAKSRMRLSGSCS
eukprot:3987727-Pyramimonas_sp.AAC.1